MKNILVIVLIVIAVAAGGFGVFTFISKSNLEKDLNTQIDISKAAVKKAKGETETAKKECSAKAAELSQVKVELKDLKEKQISAAKTELDKKDTEIADLKSAGEELQAKIESLDKINSSAQSQLEGKEKQISNLKMINETKDGKIKKLNADVQGWTGKAAAADKLAEKYKNRLLEHKIPIEPEKVFEGNVLVLLEDPDYVVVDLGVADNLPVGKVLKVIRGNHYIGDVRVEKLLVDDDERLSYSTTIKLIDETNKVKVGDKVKSK